MRRLESYDWPGNVRELENTMERAVALESGSNISLAVLPDRVAGSTSVFGPAMGESAGVQIPADGINFEQVIAETENGICDQRSRIRRSSHTAADLLKISYRSFRTMRRSITCRAFAFPGASKSLSESPNP